MYFANNGTAEGHIAKEIIHIFSYPNK